MNTSLARKLLRFAIGTGVILLLGAGAYFFAIVQPGGDGVLA